MIEHADSALESWLATLDPKVDVAFVHHVGRPDDAAEHRAGDRPDNKARTPTLALALHSVREQAVKRDNAIGDVRDPDGRVVARQRATRFFEVDYVCSVSGEAKASHRTLGALVQLLVDHDVVPPEHVPSELLELGHPIDVELVPTPLPSAALTVRVVVPVRPSADRSVWAPATELHLEMRPAPGSEDRPAPTDDEEAEGRGGVPIEERRWTTVRRRELITPHSAASTDG